MSSGSSPRAPLAFAVIVLVLFGCAYEKDVERDETRLVPLAAGCPSGDAVAEHHADSAELVDGEPLARKPLCWYRVVEDDPTFCGTTWRRIEEFSELRREMREAVPPVTQLSDSRPAGRFCTTEGLVFLVSDQDVCRPTLHGLSDAEGDLYLPPGMHAEELVAEDARAPLLLYHYEVEDTVTHRPFSCGSRGFGTL